MQRNINRILFVLCLLIPACDSSTQPRLIQPGELIIQFAPAHATITLNALSTPESSTPEPDSIHADSSNNTITFTYLLNPDTYIITLNADGYHPLTTQQTITSNQTLTLDLHLEIINTAPSVMFTATPTQGPAPLTVTFDASQSTDPQDDKLEYYWDFGDGNNATDALVQHTYTTVGDYPVTLRVRDEQGLEVTDQTIISATNTPPVAAFTINTTTGLTPLEINLDASQSSDANDSIVSYHWDFGNTDTATNPVTTYTYTLPGTYTLSLTVTDEYNTKSTTTQTITVQNRPPTADFTITNLTPGLPLDIYLDASTSTDPENTPLTYHWDFGNTDTANGPTTTYTYTIPGKHTITLTTTDQHGASATTTQDITVSYAPNSEARYPLDKLEVNGHGLTKNGEPFFWLGDTAWLIFTATTAEEAIQLLDDIKAKGFTVVQTFLTASHLYGRNDSRNAYGDAPFIDNDPTQLNPAYFDYVRWVIDEAAKRGLYTAVVFGEPARTDVPYKIRKVSVGYDYGNKLGKYFKANSDSGNIIWINGIDIAPVGKESLWKAISEGVTDGIDGIYSFDKVANYSNSMMSYHTGSGQQGLSSSQFFHSEFWLNFNSINVWKYYENLVSQVELDYSLQFKKPTICFEPSYENHDYFEFVTDWHIRFQGYWCLLSGAAGYAYGHNNGFRTVSSQYWPEYLESPGRLDMIHLKTVFTEKPFDQLVPDQGLIVSDAGEPDRDKDYVVAARAEDGGFAFVYSTNGREFEVDVSDLVTPLRARWFDPREGTYADVSFVPDDVVLFDPPGEAGAGNDWLLVLDGAP